MLRQYKRMTEVLVQVDYFTQNDWNVRKPSHYSMVLVVGDMFLKSKESEPPPPPQPLRFRYELSKVLMQYLVGLLVVFSCFLIIQCNSPYGVSVRIRTGEYARTSDFLMTTYKVRW